MDFHARGVIFFFWLMIETRGGGGNRHIDGNHILQPEEGGKEKKKVFYKDLVFPLLISFLWNHRPILIDEPNLHNPLCSPPLKQNLPPKTPPAFYVYLAFLSSRCAVNQGFRDTH